MRHRLRSLLTRMDFIGRLILAVGRRRIVMVGLWAVARTILVASAALLLAWVAAALLGHGWGARTVALLSLGGGVGWVAALVWRERSLLGDEGVARLIGCRFPTVASDFLSVVQLRREALGPEPLFSETMLNALATGTVARLGDARASDVVSTRDAGRPLALILGATLAVGIVVWLGKPSLAILAGVAEPPAKVVGEPLLSDLRVDYEYPAYMGRKPRSVEGSDGTLAGPKGTQVRVRGRTTRPLRDVEIVPEDASAPLRASVSDGLVEFRIVLRQSRSYRVRGRLAGGQRVIERGARSVIVETDELPRVELLAPADDLEVDGQATVPLAYTAEDDFGIGSLDLVWREGQAVETRVPLQPESLQGTRIEGKTSLDLMLEDLDEPVFYWLEATDNDTVSGPKKTRSRVFSVRLRRDGDRRENALAAQTEALERAIQHLGDRLEIDPRERPALSLNERLRDVIAAVGAARNATAEDRFASEDLVKVLGQIHERLVRLQAAETRGSAAAVRRRAIAEMERDVLELDRWIAMQRIEDLMALADRIERDRKRLAERLARLQSGDEEERAEIGRELAFLEQRVRELMARAADLSRELPHEYLNPDAVSRDLLAELSAARQLLDSGDVEGAKDALAKLGEFLDQAMTAMASGPGGERAAARRKALAEALEEVGRLREEQSGIADDTAKIEERARAEDDRDPGAFVEEQRRKAERLRRSLEDVDAAKLDEPDRKALHEARPLADALGELLEKLDLPGALGVAEGARDRLAGRAGSFEEPSELAGQIAADLKAALSEPPVAEADRRPLGELAERQEETRGRAAKLSERIEKLAGEVPELGETGPALQDAGRAMGRGASNMRGGRPRSGHQAAREAADRLASLEQSLREAQRSSGAGRGMEREPVKVPGAEAFRVPREWREQILEAMKEGAPEGYRELVRRYYEELIR